MNKKRIKSFFSPRLSGKTVKIGKRRGNKLLFYNPSSGRAFVFGAGTALLITALVFLAYLYYPLAGAVWRYKFGPTPVMPAKKQVVGNKVDYTDFYIYIPKIKASAPIFANVPPGDKVVYMPVLRKGVAHALGTGFPGRGKTIYLFAHSTDTSFNVVRLNAVFFLINRLEKGDKVIIFFNGRKYIYSIYKKVIAEAKETKYLSYREEGREVLILQSCWPPGTIWKRLLVFGKLTAH